MRVVSLLVATLLVAAPVFAQQASSENTTPARSETATANQQSTKTITVDLYPPPAHPITAAQVHELLELTGAKQLGIQMMRGMMVNLRKTFPPFVPKDVIDDIEASLEKMDLESMAVVAYQKHLSTEDAAQVIAFYKTPAGGRIIAVLPQITQEMQAAGAKEGMRIVQQVIARHMDEIKAAAAKYKQEHSDEPKITSPN
ncbi:MAG: DUF2059 domain-containing protein [Acidobacteriaceae bacterium]